MLQTDTIVGTVLPARVDSPTVRRHEQPTPAEVLEWLPENATPEQQDSAIQANIKPSKIHWSEQPDTLHLPGHPVGKSIYDVSLPQYYRESFFSDSPFFHPELKGGRQGVAGDPVPYTIAGDNLITGVLLGCFLLAMVAFAQLHRFIARQAKYFFYVPRSNTTLISETSAELRFQLFLVLQTCLLLSLGYFFYMQDSVGKAFILEQYQIIGIYTGVFALYFMTKVILYSIVNWVFFERRENEIWMSSYLFLMSAEGVILFPLVMLQVYFGLALETGFFYSVLIIVLIKLLSLSKAYIIFFRRSIGFLQIILYFCALEVMPFLALYGALIMISSYLQVTF